MPRIREIWPESQLKSVLSLAPPPMPPGLRCVRLANLKNQWKRRIHLLRYMLAQLTDGDTIYRTVVDQHPDVLFMRSRPNSKKYVKFVTDDVHVQLMAEAMDYEVKHNNDYLPVVFDPAATIAVRMVEYHSKEHVKMFREIANSMVARRQFHVALYICEEMAQHLQKQATNCFSKCLTYFLQYPVQGMVSRHDCGFCT